MWHYPQCNCSLFSHQVCDWPWFHASHGKGGHSHRWNERSWCGDGQECDSGGGPVGHHPGWRCGRVERPVFSGNFVIFQTCTRYYFCLKAQYAILKNLSWFYVFNILQFYLKESDLGQNRALCSEKQLSSLNVYVRVTAHTEKLNEEFLQQFQVSLNFVFGLNPFQVLSLIYVILFGTIGGRAHRFHFRWAATLGKVLPCKQYKVYRGW